ncbi:MAG: adenosine kinase [Bacteroidales bacterium]
MTKNIVGAGSALMDFLFKTPDNKTLEQFNLPPGSMTLIDAEKSDKIINAAKHLEMDLAGGGSAGNTINAIAKLGGHCGFIGKIGNDELGETYKKELIKSNVNTHLGVENTSTGRAITFITPDSERTFATCLGAATHLSPDDISDDILRQYDYLYIEGYLVFNEPLIKHLLDRAKALGLKIAMDMASFNVVEESLDFFKKALPEYVDILFANEEEAKAFTGSNDPQVALEIFAQLCDIAVVKVGKKGSWVRSGKQSLKIEAVDVNAIDTTGAGDAYAAGFMYGIANDLSLQQCGNLGSLLSAHTVRGEGARLPEKTWEEIKPAIRRIIEGK